VLIVVNTPRRPSNDRASGWGTPEAASLLTALQGTDGCPTVTSVSPTSGPTAGGTSVTVGGSGFTGATAVHFGANAATNVVGDGAGTSLTATTPAGTER